MLKTTRKTRAQWSVAAVFCAGLLVAGSAFAEQGGVKDSSGLIWSENQMQELGYHLDWGGASNGAANYRVIENGVTYDDWRLPTIAEIQKAIIDGTMQKLTRYPDPLDPHLVYTIWALETRGNKAYLVSIVYSDIANCIIDVTASGGAWLAGKGSWMDACYVRGRPAPKK